MKKKFAIVFCFIFVLSGIICACGKKADDGQTADKPKPETAKEKVEGTELSTAFWKLIYPEDWTFNKEEDLKEKETYADATLSVMDGENAVVKVSINVSIEDTGSYRKALKNAGIDAYEMVENNAVEFIDIGGVDFVSNEKNDKLSYLARVENAKATVEIRVTGAIDDPRVDTLLGTVEFTLKDDGNVDPPWPWNGERIAFDAPFTNLVADNSITTTLLSSEEPIIVNDIFSGRIAVTGNSLWVLIDGRLFEYELGDTIKVKREIPLDKDYEEISADKNGNIYLTGFMSPMITMKDGTPVAENKGVDRARIHSSGTWGISYFTNSPIKKVTIDQNIASVSEWDIIDKEKVSEVSLSDNYIFINGKDGETNNHAVWVFDLEGNQKAVLGNKSMGDPDWLGWITQMIEAKNGFIGLDGNMRKVCFWKSDGTYIGTLDDGEMFGTSYPWMSTGVVLDDGSILIGLTEERPDDSAVEFLVYKLTGF